MENTRTISEYIIVNAVPTLPACYDTMASDGYGPVECQSGFAVSGVRCTGKYCDNMYVTCCPYQSTSDPLATYVWSSWFSEESPNNKYISGNGFMCGLKAKGDYSDQLALKILTSPNLKHTGACQRLGSFSEEQAAGAKCSTGSFATGIECYGDNCDNMYLTCCPSGK